MVPLRLTEALRNPDFVAALTSTTSVQWSVVGIRSSLVPLFIVGPLGLTQEWSYVCFFVVSVVTGALLTPSGRRADAHNRLVMLAGGLLVEAGRPGRCCPRCPHLYGLLPAMVLLGTAGAVLSVVPGAIVGGVVGERSGTVVASYQMAGDAGSVAGPLVAGFLADRYGFATSFYVAAAVVTVLPLLAVARAARRLGGSAAQARRSARITARCPGPATRPFRRRTRTDRRRLTDVAGGTHDQLRYRIAI